jgi:hypothetical protein
MGSANAIQEAVGGLILLVAHPGKDPEKGIRGHSSLYAGLDASIAVLRDKKTQGLFWRVDKAKDGEMGSDFWFERTTINLGIDDEDELITSQAIRPMDKVEVETQPLPDPCGELMDCLWDLYTEDETPKPVRAKAWEEGVSARDICSLATFHRMRSNLETRGYVKKVSTNRKEVYYEPQK